MGSIIENERKCFYSEKEFVVKNERRESTVITLIFDPIEEVQPIEIQSE